MGKTKSGGGAITRTRGKERVSTSEGTGSTTLGIRDRSCFVAPDREAAGVAKTTLFHPTYA